MLGEAALEERQPGLPAVPSCAAGQEEFHGNNPVGLADRRGGVANVWQVADELKIPAPDDEARLWSLIEAAWAPLGPDVRQARQALIIRPAGSQAETSVVMGALRKFLDVMACGPRMVPTRSCPIRARHRHHR